LFGKRNKVGLLPLRFAKRAKLPGFENWRRGKPRPYGSEKQYPRGHTVWRAESKGKQEGDVNLLPTM